jgi:hypothetical protein
VLTDRRKDPCAAGVSVPLILSNSYSGLANIMKIKGKELWMLAVSITIPVSLQMADILLRFLVGLERYLDQVLGSLATR